jgi:hypothetical protein
MAEDRMAMLEAAGRRVGRARVVAHEQFGGLEA